MTESLSGDRLVELLQHGTLTHMENIFIWVAASYSQALLLHIGRACPRLEPLKICGALTMDIILQTDLDAELFPELKALVVRLLDITDVVDTR